MKTFHEIIKAAALEFARANAIVMPGDYVMTQWGDWKKPHKVQISSVGAALAHSEFDEEKREFPAILEMTYCAVRLKADGTPKDNPHYGQIVLTSFVTQDGRAWQQSRNIIENATVQWDLPESRRYHGSV